MADNQFYLRYYVGHTGKYGHEFLEFEFRPDGEVRGCPWQLRAADGLLLLLLRLSNPLLLCFCRCATGTTQTIRMTQRSGRRHTFRKQYWTS
jgi:hypothetical protein